MYAVYLKYPESKIEAVLEYFETLEEAQKYFKKVKRSLSYEVHIGEFVSTFGE